MVLTRVFKETIQARVERGPAFREAQLKEGVECLLSADVETGKAVFRDYPLLGYLDRMGYSFVWRFTGREAGLHPPRSGMLAQAIAPQVRRVSCLSRRF